MNTEKLDEAAVKYQIDTYGPRVFGGGGILSDEEFMQWNKNIDFIAGAKWMAEQGITKEGEVFDNQEFIKFPDGTYIDLDPAQQLRPAFQLKDGDKVIVQIRKKD